MTIGINGNEANVEHLVGVNQYAQELLCALAQFTVHSSRLVGGQARFTVYLSRLPLSGMPEETENFRYKILGPAKLWTLTKLQYQLLKEKIQGAAPEVFFTPTHYAPLFLPCPSVISIMDMSFARFPEYFKKRDLYQLKYWTQISARRARKIITISEFSKKEICQIYHLPEERVIVTYPGYDRERFQTKIKDQRARIKDTTQKYKIYNNYLLYIGTLQPRKNLVRLIEAFYGLRATGHVLVIAGMISEGRGGWQYEEIFRKVRELGLRDRVIFTGYVPDGDVPFLLAGAKAFVLPSLYEGFGIPAIEAMATGVPVVVSKVSSLPEICGEAAIYIADPYQIGSIRRALQDLVLLTLSQRAKRVQVGLEWVKRYNWKETARATIETIKSIKQ